MKWDKIVELILLVGIPTAEKIWQKWTAGADVTQADWDELKAAAYQTAKDRMLKVLQAQGIDPESPQGKALLALTV